MPSLMYTLVCFQMLMDPMGGIVMTNDGNAILREVHSCTSVVVHILVTLIICIFNFYEHLRADFFIELISIGGFNYVVDHSRTSSC